jgi:short-subunit dehydrogenase
MSNNQKWVLVTGGTSGIGYELAKLFAGDQYNLVIAARTQSELDCKAAEFKQMGAEVITMAKDLSNLDQAISLCQEISGKGIKIDVLVNDAGRGLRFI